MKTLQELYTEVMASDEMKKEFIEAFKQKEATEAALKKYSCDASFEEFQAFMKEKQEDDEIVNEEDVKAIAGGTSKYEALVNVGVSVASLLFGCGGKVLASEIREIQKEDPNPLEGAKCRIG